MSGNNPFASLASSENDNDKNETAEKDQSSSTGGSGFLFRQSKLSSIGDKIEKSWASSSDQNSTNNSAENKPAPIESIFSKGGGIFGGKSSNGKSTDEKITISSKSYVFGSNINKRVADDEPNSFVPSAAKSADDDKKTVEEEKPFSNAFEELAEKANQEGENKKTEDEQNSATDQGSKAESSLSLAAASGEKDKSRWPSGSKNNENGSNGGATADQVTNLKESAAKQYNDGKTAAVEKPPGEIEVTTGEEDENNLFHGSCKLHQYIKSEDRWMERGGGQLRINRKLLEDDKNETRLVMRVTGSLRVVLNSKVWSDMFLERLSPKRLKLSAFDPERTGEVCLWLLTSNQSDSSVIERLIVEAKKNCCSPVENNQNKSLATKSDNHHKAQENNGDNAEKTDVPQEKEGTEKAESDKGKNEMSPAKDSDRKRKGCDSVEEGETESKKKATDSEEAKLVES